MLYNDLIYIPISFYIEGFIFIVQSQVIFVKIRLLVKGRWDIFSTGHSKEKMVAVIVKNNFNFGSLKSCFIKFSQDSERLDHDKSNSHFLQKL